MADAEIEVLYEPAPAPRRALLASWIGAGLFMVFVFWLLSQLLRSTRAVIIAAVVTAVVLIAQSRYAPGGVRATRRVTAHRRERTLTFEWRGGEAVIAWDAIDAIEVERVTGGDGIDLAAVVLRPGGGELMRFGFGTDAAAKGVVDAVEALRASPRGALESG